MFTWSACCRSWASALSAARLHCSWRCGTHHCLALFFCICCHSHWQRLRAAGKNQDICKLASRCICECPAAADWLHSSTCPVGSRLAKACRGQVVRGLFDCSLCCLAGGGDRYQRPRAAAEAGPRAEGEGGRRLPARLQGHREDAQEAGGAWQALLGSSRTCRAGRQRAVHKMWLGQRVQSRCKPASEACTWHMVHPVMHPLTGPAHAPCRWWTSCLRTGRWRRARTRWRPWRTPSSCAPPLHVQDSASLGHKLARQSPGCPEAMC